jgi:urease accessory protein
MQTLRAHTVLPAGTWPNASACDSIALTYDERHRRRFAFTAQGGTAFLLDLPRATVLQQGDGLALTDGRIIAVSAARERLSRVEASSAQALVQLAWHIGNRHLPAQLTADAIFIREDHVITHMLEGLGARVTPVDAPFRPESGAYAGGHGNHPQHGHQHEHEHAHQHGQEHDHAFKEHADIHEHTHAHLPGHANDR